MRPPQGGRVAVVGGRRPSDINTPLSPYSNPTIRPKVHDVYGRYLNFRGSISLSRPSGLRTWKPPLNHVQSDSPRRRSLYAVSILENDRLSRPSRSQLLRG